MNSAYMFWKSNVIDMIPLHYTFMLTILCKEFMEINKVFQK